MLNILAALLVIMFGVAILGLVLLCSFTLILALLPDGEEGDDQ